MQELQHRSVAKREHKHDEDVSSFICSWCVQKLLEMSQGELVEACHLAMEKGYAEKASWFKSFINENMEVSDVQQTEKVRRNPFREKIMRLARPRPARLTRNAE
jgi:hypothetical protein